MKITLKGNKYVPTNTHERERTKSFPLDAKNYRRSNRTNSEDCSEQNTTSLHRLDRDNRQPTKTGRVIREGEITSPSKNKKGGIKMKYECRICGKNNEEKNQLYFAYAIPIDKLEGEPLEVGDGAECSVCKECTAQIIKSIVGNASEKEHERFAQLVANIFKTDISNYNPFLRNPTTTSMRKFEKYVYKTYTKKEKIK